MIAVQLVDIRGHAIESGHQQFLDPTFNYSYLHRQHKKEKRGRERLKSSMVVPKLNEGMQPPYGMRGGGKTSCNRQNSKIRTKCSILLDWKND